MATSAKSASESLAARKLVYDESDFQQRIDDFLELIDKMTMRNELEYSAEERRLKISENLRFDEFCGSIRELLGPDIHNQDLKLLYKKITANPDAKFDWTEIFGYLQTSTEEDGAEQNAQVSAEESNVYMESKRWTIGEAAGEHRRRDVVQFVTTVPAVDATVAVSQKGAVTMWGPKLQLLSTTDLNESSWATAVTYMSGNRRMVASTERSIHFFDHRNKGKTQQVFAVKPMSQTPLCLSWVPYSQRAGEDTLIFGDDKGFVNFMTITNHDLTAKQIRIDRRTVISTTIDPKSLSVPIKRRKFANDWLLRVKYFSELKCFGCCSPDPDKSFYLEPIEKISDESQPIRPVSVPKGVNAIDYCVKANVLVTGGVDKVLRVWLPHIFGRPTGRLMGHLFTICDITVNQKDQHVISLSTARVFRIWDIQSLACLQRFEVIGSGCPSCRRDNPFWDNRKYTFPKSICLVSNYHPLD